MGGGVLLSQGPPRAHLRGNGRGLAALSTSGHPRPTPGRRVPWPLDEELAPKTQAGEANGTRLCSGPGGTGRGQGRGSDLGLLQKGEGICSEHTGLPAGFARQRSARASSGRGSRPEPAREPALQRRPPSSSVGPPQTDTLTGPADSLQGPVASRICELGYPEPPPRAHSAHTGAPGVAVSSSGVQNPPLPLFRPHPTAPRACAPVPQVKPVTTLAIS